MRWRSGLGLTLVAGLAAGSAAAQEAAPAEAAPGFSDIASWVKAPLALSGSLIYDFLGRRSREEGSSHSYVLTGTLNARTYLYQPWFATVGGTLRLTTSRSASTAGTLSSGPEEAASRDQFVSGNGRLDLFPRSRFPFEVHWERTDSRADSTIAPSFNYQTQVLGFSQRYRPADSSYNLAGSYERREQAGMGFRDVQDSISADFSTRWKYQDVALGLALNQARRPATDENSQFRSLIARHNYAPQGPYTINTTFNLTQTVENLVGSPVDLTVLQFTSMGMWHRDASPLTLTGSVRGLVLRNGVISHNLDNYGATVGANYEFSRNLRLAANAAVSISAADSVRAHSLASSVTGSWQADTVEWNGLRYERFVSASGGAVTTRGTDLDETQANMSLQAGHSLAKSLTLGERSALVLQLSQTLTVAHVTSSRVEPVAVRTSSRYALHSAAATWNISGNNRQAYARLTASDSRELGGGRAAFQLLNFQLSGTFEFDRFQQLSGDLTVQRTVQRPGDALAAPGIDPVVGERTATTSASGEITYRQQRLFGVPGLRFTSRIKLAQDVLRQPGMLPNLPDHESRMWENRLDWSIGRLETGLMFRLSQIDGKQHDFLMLRAQRSFGN